MCCPTPTPQAIDGFIAAKSASRPPGVQCHATQHSALLPFLSLPISALDPSVFCEHCGLLYTRCCAQSGGEAKTQSGISGLARFSRQKGDVNLGVASTTPKLVLKPVPDMPIFAQAMPSAGMPFCSPLSSPNCKSTLPQKASMHLPDPLPASGRVEEGCVVLLQSHQSPPGNTGTRTYAWGTPSLESWYHQHLGLGVRREQL